MPPDTKTDAQTTTAKNPWRFLTALDGNDETDRDLLALTRKDEIQIIANMVAASRVSILYAFSGNGKTSLINAGLIPFFITNGYAVFKMRPRPPWSIENPCQAFKDSILRDISLPLFRRADLEILETVLGRLTNIPEAMNKEIENFLDRLKSKISSLADNSLDIANFKASLGNHLDKPLVEFVSHLQSVLDPEANILFICDQFEELFVHYGNTPEMHEFVSQLGEVWADNSLRAHLLFSMREDWVGNMIEFRRAVPDIFTNYFKLNPLTRSRAGNILTLPLRTTVGLSFENKAVEQLLDDLVQAYSINQKESFSEVTLTPSPEGDPFIELPALQVLADKLWETKGTVDKPFTLAHYESLKNSDEEEPTAKTVSIDKAEHPEDDFSPAQVVLDNYMTDLLDNTPASDKLSPKEWREFQIDFLYLLTDKIRHRRALPEHHLLEEVKKIRPPGLELPAVDEALLMEAIKPLVKIRLVREEATKDGKKQYELAHDFAVRSAVRNWRQLDRERTSELAIINAEKQEKEEKLIAFEKNQRRTLRFLQIVPALALFVLIYSFYKLLGNVTTVQQSLTFVSAGLLLPFSLVLTVGLLVQHKLSVLLASLCGSSACVYLYLINSILKKSSGTSLTDEHFALLFAIPFLVFLLLTYYRVIYDISKRLNDSLIIQKIFSILWSELVDILIISLIAAIIFLYLIISNSLSIDGEIGLLLYSILFSMVPVLIFSVWISKEGKTPGYHWAGISIKGVNKESLSFGHAVLRQLLFVLWFITLIYSISKLILKLNPSPEQFLITLLFVGPIFLWSAIGSLIIWFTKDHRNIYDVLAGTKPVFIEDTTTRIYAKRITSMLIHKSTIEVARIFFALPFGVIGLLLLGPMNTTILESQIGGGNIAVYFAGLIFIASCVSISMQKFVNLSSLLLTGVLGIVIFTIDLPALKGENTPLALLNLLKDSALAAGTLLYASIFLKNVNKQTLMITIARTLFALCLCIIGVLHFVNVEQLAPLVPKFADLGILWIYVLGSGLFATGIGILTKQMSMISSSTLAAILIIFILTIHFPKALDGNSISIVHLLKDMALAAIALTFSSISARRDSESGEKFSNEEPLIVGSTGPSFSYFKIVEYFKDAINKLVVRIVLLIAAALLAYYLQKELKLLDWLF